MSRLALLLPLLLAGCLEKDPLYCEVNTDCTGGMVCDVPRKTCTSSVAGDMAMDGSMMSDLSLSDLSGCLSNMQCPTAMPICTNGVCGPCGGDGGLTSDAGASSECTDHPMTPYCANGACVQCAAPIHCLGVNLGCINGKCAACMKNDDCASGLCNNGACVDPSMLVYVSSTGPSCPAGPGTGTFADPYCSLQKGMDTAAGTNNHYVIVLGGTYTEDIKVSNPNMDYTVNLIALGKPTISPKSANVPVIQLQNNGNHIMILSFDGVVLTGASGGAGDGIACGGNGSTSNLQVKLLRSTITKNAHAGFNGYDCLITMDQDVIGPMNDDGGIFMSACDFTITNTLIFRNGGGGNNGSDQGGITLQQGPPAVGVLFNDTIVNNSAKNFSTSGLNCSGNMITANLAIFGNSTSSQMEITNCNQLDHCAFVGGKQPNTDLTGCMGDDVFVSSAFDDYHVGIKSMKCSLQDRGATMSGNPPVNAPDHDLDGKMRPANLGFDIGAYELQ
jgi:hypothetical protein